LVHGLCAGAWCWEQLTSHLEAAGHDVVAVDLPCEDPEARFTDYAAVVHDALRSANEEVVLVGHSAGGLTIPLVAARRPVRELVFLCALIPEPGKPEGFEFRVGDPSEWMAPNEDGSFSVRPEAFASHVAQDVDPTLALDAGARLRRQFLAPFAEPCPLASMPDVACRYVLCREDRIVSPDWSRRVARERLGVDPMELPGSHSPMASRPRELADLLLS
jgi:pimeloyl-ACP methyl ester carboxylesterase